jgi:hypothetical protein
MLSDVNGFLSLPDLSLNDEHLASLAPSALLTSFAALAFLSPSPSLSPCSPYCSSLSTSPPRTLPFVRCPRFNLVLPIDLHVPSLGSRSGLGGLLLYRLLLLLAAGSAACPGLLVGAIDGPGRLQSTREPIRMGLEPAADWEGKRWGRKNRRTYLLKACP